MSWKGFEGVKYAILECVAWLYTQRSETPLGSFPPAEFYEHRPSAKAARAEPSAVSSPSHLKTRGGSTDTGSETGATGLGQPACSLAKAPPTCRIRVPRAHHPTPV